ncbi:hypothetical protein Prum_032280 [Phytohabitans rumicis]|uniref:Glycoside hydrolase family 38 central domain-containing protein n=1 Tax=Phytohabitans rumicis TaxID=1076125 RepID=A0A6V8L656_9ACTN|nr:hypothetical protein Prum_032280 [Phytohabitans rumicis]
MHDDRIHVERRLDRLYKERILPAKYSARVPLQIEVWYVPDEPVPVAEALAATYRASGVGEPWGTPWSTAWFRVTGQVPAEWAGRRVELVVDLGFTGGGPGFQAEGLVYDRAGRPIKGVAPRNMYVPIASPARGGEDVALLIEAAANPDVGVDGFKPTPLGDKATAGKEPLYRLAAVDLAVLDEEAWHLALDFEVLSGLMAELSTHDPRRHEILRAMERAADVLDAQDVAGTATAARTRLAAVLASPAHASAHTLAAVGHAHIDSAWLWPQRETIRKSARTFANVTALAAEYPEFIFAASQAQQYAWVKTHQPAVFQRIGEAVKAGQWAPVGGMWVESDANLPGGEALARQLVHGKRFFMDEFGVECEEIWLPDSFGYTAAFPQIARLAGVRWFLTQKLSWNQTNKLPHHTFRWEGIDGTRVFTHFPPVDTYNSEFSGSELAHAVANYAEKGAGTRSLVPFGWGDGGGGPTREMLEKARRLHDLEGSPRVVIEKPADFFRAAEAEYPDAPVWSGELYLELHRATYTSQARTKAGNRRSEHLLREAELWAATASVRTGAAYPYEALDRLWKVVLLHQFHDILPGSSIAWVHQETEATYARVAEELNRIVDSALSTLGGGVFNAAPHPRTEVVDGTLVTVPALGVAAVAATASPAAVTVDGLVLDNGLVRVEVDENGLLTSVRDLTAGREVLAPGSRATCCSCTPTCRTSGTRGTSTRTTAGSGWTSPRPARSPLSTVDRWSAPSGSSGSSARRASRRPSGYAPAAAASTSRRTSTGTRSRRSSRRRSRSTCTPTARPPRSSSVTSTGRHTTTPAGIRPASRCTPIGGCTCPSPATGWRCSTTRRTATTSPARPGTATGAPRPRSGSAWSGRPVSPTRRRTRDCTASRTPCCPAPPLWTRWPRGTR